MDDHAVIDNRSAAQDFDSYEVKPRVSVGTNGAGSDSSAGSIGDDGFIVAIRRGIGFAIKPVGDFLARAFASYRTAEVDWGVGSYV